MKIRNINQVELNSINLSDPFFDSLRESYQGFNKWFVGKAKSGKKAYVVYSDDNKIIGFLLLKPKDDGTMKISTFKVLPSNKRIGERFIGIALKQAVINKCKSVYLTLFENNKTKPLIKLLEDWGFAKLSQTRDNGELIYSRNIGFDISATPKQNYPLNIINTNAKFYWLPIKSQLHNKLIGFDAESKRLDKTYDDRASIFTIEKYYISAVPEYKLNRLKTGDILVLYRNGPDEVPGSKKYTSIVTGYCVFEKYESLQNLTQEQFLTKVKNRTAYDENELIQIHQETSGRFVSLISFLFISKIAKTDTQYWILNDLYQMGIIEQGKGPRPLDPISKDHFNKLYKK